MSQGSARVEAVLGQARGLLNQGRFDDALSLLQPVAERRDAPPAVLSMMAASLKALGRGEAALPFARRAARLNPSSVARHNLGALLGDLGLNAEAEAAARGALAVGGSAPETWLVLARALQGQGQFDGAETAYRQAVARRPGYADALADLAQLVWMRTADIGQAVGDLDAALRHQPDDATLRMMKARLLDYAGDRDGGYAALTARPLDARGHLAAAQMSLGADPERALAHLDAVRPTEIDGRARDRVNAEVMIALGRPDAAKAPIQRLRAASPLDQYALALETTVLRMTGDPAYRSLCDYSSMVQAGPIDTPDGWPTLEAYLVDLGVALQALHGLRTHPVGQSLRGGSQTMAPLTRSADPAIRAFFLAIDGPIRRYIARLGPGLDPLRARNTGRYAVAGSWSVRLRPHGFHADHVHSQGWLSSACHIDLPSAVSADGQQGWLRFGRPAIQPPGGLDGDYAVRPVAGALVLFPSYMWHGTVPFAGDADRLTIAFDLVPA